MVLNMNRKIKLYELLKKSLDGAKDCPKTILYREAEYHRVKDGGGTFFYFNDSKGSLMQMITSFVQFKEVVDILDEENDEFEEIEESKMLVSSILKPNKDSIKIVVNEHSVNLSFINNKLNQLIRNQKKIIEKLNKDEQR